MLLKRIVYKFADKLGYTIIPNWMLDDYLIVKRLTKIISEKQIDCVIDVGANIGQYRNLIRNFVGFEGLIISFEPDPANYIVLEQLKAKLNDQKWIIKNYALGKENARLPFNIMNDSVFNSFLTPNQFSYSHFSGAISVKNTIEVPVFRLDNIITKIQEEHHFSRALLKIDTQGYDMDVFEGSYNSLSLIYAIQTELSFTPIYENMATLDQTIPEFKAKGFEVSGIYSLSESRFPIALEYDCLLIR